MVDPESLTEEQQEGLALYVQAEGIQVTDQATLEAAVNLRWGLKGLIERIEEHWKPIKARERAVWQASVADEKKWLEGPLAALKMLNERMVEFETKQRREKARLEQLAADEAKMAAEVAKRDGIALPPMVTPAAPAAQAKVAGLSFSTHYKGVVLDKMALLKAVLEGKVDADVIAVDQSALDEIARLTGPQTAAKDHPGKQYEMPGVPGVALLAERRARG